MIISSELIEKANTEVRNIGKITYNDHQQDLPLLRQKFVLINLPQVQPLQQRHTVAPWLLEETEVNSKLELCGLDN